MLDLTRCGLHELLSCCFVGRDNPFNVRKHLFTVVWCSLRLALSGCYRYFLLSHNHLEWFLLPRRQARMVYIPYQLELFLPNPVLHMCYHSDCHSFEETASTAT